ncbi:MAG: hypothetical protein GQ564_17420 [Bacteroidales bacterium]|nr:hypothetical protein [Bacteroidales bacterium]
MRRISFLFLLVVCLFSNDLFSQTTGNFNYQAVIRDNNGDLITNQSISVQLSIIDLTADGTEIYKEAHSVTSTSTGLINLLVGNGIPSLGDFTTINWGLNSKFINIEIDAGSGFVEMGTFQLFSVPFAHYANSSETANIAEVLGSDGVYSTSSDTLFVVKDHSGNVVFAVFPDGAQIIVNEAAKGKVGGFAVSGRSPSKAVDIDILKVTADSTRIYVNDDPTAKGKVGGFAVSGRSPSKGITGDYLQVTRDSTRVYINDDGTKGKVGGFAVSGRSPSKAGIEKDYFNISANITAEKINNESRIMWYPSKSALLAGEIYVPDPDSVGQYSMSLGYRNIAKGQWSQAMGYQSVARGPYSTAIGYETIADTNSFAFGTGSKALGYNSFAFGSVGLDSLGNITTNFTKASGDYSFAFGLGSEAIGLGSFVLGNDCEAFGDFSMAAGFKTEASGFSATAMGANNIASGNYALAFGTLNQALGSASVAFGLGNTAEGLQSMVAGRNNIAVGVGAIALGTSNTANGDGTFIAGNSNSCTQTYATAFGTGNTASASYAFATGSGTQAAGQGSLSSGQFTTASGDNSLVIGYGTETTANGDNAFAAGLNTIASGYGSMASGESTQAVGKYSVALGYNTIAPSYGCVVIGKWNETTSGTSTSWNPPNNGTDPIFIIGNGLNGGGFENDALIVYRNGNMKIDGDFYPASDDSYDLGSIGARWQDIYTNGVVNTSDMRLKSDISNINYGLNEVLKLRPVTFLWKDKPGKGMRLGLIAQEVQPIINEVIYVGDDENQTLGVRYSDLIPVLIKSIQEQQKIIEDQNKKNKELEDQLKEINEKLKLIEQKLR